MRSNEPTMLNDKSLYFPNLPKELRSGILADLSSNKDNPTFKKISTNQEGLYRMFSGTLSHLFNSNTHKILNTQPLRDFFKCGGEKLSNLSEQIELLKIHPKSSILKKIPKNLN